MFSNSFDAVIPVICVTLAALVVMLAEAFRGRGERMPLGGLAIIGLVGAAAASVLLWNRNATSFGVMTADNFSIFVNLVIITVGILTVVVSSQTIERDNLPAGEYYATLLFAIVGMMLMAQATDLLLIFLALETMSIAVYVLTGIRRELVQSTEAAFKYFLLGAFASSFFLYGIAFLYGVTGTTNLERVGSVIAAQSMSGNPMILLGRRPAARRLRLQGGGSAVPHVVARRLRGRARRRHRLHVHRRQGGRGGGLRPRVPVGARTDGHRLGAGPLGDCRADDGGGHGGRRGADQPEAHARVFEHRARRLPAARPSSPAATWARPRSSSTSPPTR